MGLAVNLDTGVSNGFVAGSIIPTDGEIGQFNALVANASTASTLTPAVQTYKDAIAQATQDSGAPQTFTDTENAFKGLGTLNDLFKGDVTVGEEQETGLFETLGELNREGVTSGTLATSADKANQIYKQINEASLFLYGKSIDENFNDALTQLVKDGVVTQDQVKTITAAYAAYKTIDATMRTFQGTPGAGAVAIDNLGLLISQILPGNDAAGITSSLSLLKTTFTTAQNLVNGAQGEKDGFVKAAVSLFTNGTIFGGEFAKTAGQVVAGYKLVQNAVNFANNEAGAGQKALDAVALLGQTGVIGEDVAKLVQGAGASYKLVQNTVNALNGEPLAGVKALNAADLLGKLGVLGPQISSIIDTGVKTYSAVSSVLNLVNAPSLATGLGAIGAVANLIGGGTFSTIANIATLGFGIVTGGVGAIIGGLVGLFGGLFGGGKQYTTISDQLDANNDGRTDTIRFESKNDDWYYNVNAADLKVSTADFRLEAQSIYKTDDEGRIYVERDSGDGIYRDYSYGRYNFGGGEQIYRFGYDGDMQPVESSYSYKLTVNYNYERINDAPSLEMPGNSQTIDLTPDQYNALRQQLGGDSGSMAPADGRFGVLQQYAPLSGGTYKIRQEKKNEGMTFYQDVNGDSIRDRLTKYVHLKGQTDGDDSTYIELRNASGQTWLAYSIDANGNPTSGGRAADKLRSLFPGANTLNVGGTQIYGSVDYTKMALRPEDQLNVLRYIASNPDLIAAFGLDVGRGYGHMISNGVSENRQVSFDPAAYLAANPDVAAATGGSQIGAAQHYIQYGYNENRVLRDVSQDMNGDGAADRVLVFRDRIEATTTSASGIQTVTRYNTQGAFLSATGDFDSDGVRDEAVLQADGTIRITATEGAVRVSKVVGADGSLREISGDLTGDGFTDTITADGAGGYVARLGGSENTVIATGSGATIETALRSAIVATPQMQLRVLEYIASNADLIAAFGTDIAKGYEHMTTLGEAEKRQISFSGQAYLDVNPDLKASLGNDPLKAAEYYIKGGYTEDRWLRGANVDVNGDGVADSILVARDKVVIALLKQDGTTARVVAGATLEEATAKVNIISLLSWIAADDARIQTYGTNVVAAQSAIATDTGVGDPKASLNILDFSIKESERVKFYEGDLVSILASYILERREKLKIKEKEDTTPNT